MVARLDIGDVLADRLDDAGAFVPEHDRGRGRIEPLDEVQIAMAKPGKGGAQHDFAAPRLLQRDVLDRQRLVRRVQDGGFHPNLPLSGRRMLTLRGVRVTPRSEPSSTGRALGAPAEPG